jgi:hypothetical protein
LPRIEYEQEYNPFAMILALSIILAYVLLLLKDTACGGGRF